MQQTYPGFFQVHLDFRYSIEIHLHKYLLQKKLENYHLLQAIPSLPFRESLMLLFLHLGYPNKTMPVYH